MKLDSQEFKRAQKIMREFCNINLSEQELIKIATACIQANFSRRSGTTFNQQQVEYRMNKIESEEKISDLLDETFKSIGDEETNLLAKGKIKGKEILGRTKLWFEEVPAKIKKGLDK
jgi:hypothetical protein